MPTSVETIFANIKKTHQAPECKRCGKPYPRLDQSIMICKKCIKNKIIMDDFL